MPTFKAYTEEDIQDAIRYHRKHPGVSINKAAALYGIPPRTLGGRINQGRQNRQIAHKDQQLLSIEQEEKLVEWIIRCSTWGLSPRKILVEEMAFRIADIQDVRIYRIGIHWYDRFVVRHSSKIESSLSVTLERFRHNATKPAVIINFFDQIKEIVALYNIKPWNFYNMDEKPFIIGLGGRYIICHKRGLLRATQTTCGGRESITVLEAGSASGK